MSSRPRGPRSKSSQASPALLVRQMGLFVALAYPEACARASPGCSDFTVYPYLPEGPVLHASGSNQVWATDPSATSQWPCLGCTCMLGIGHHADLVLAPGPGPRSGLSKDGWLTADVLCVEWRLTGDVTRSPCYRCRRCRSWAIRLTKAPRYARPSAFMQTDLMQDPALDAPSAWTAQGFSLGRQRRSRRVRLWPKNSAFKYEDRCYQPCIRGHRTPRLTAEKVAEAATGFSSTDDRCLAEVTLFSLAAAVLAPIAVDWSPSTQPRSSAKTAA